jgi:hypothetical protein
VEIVYPLDYVSFEGNAFVKKKKKRKENETLPGDRNRHD